MEELKVLMEGLSRLSGGATTAFAWWCAKEVFVYSMAPLTFIIIGVTMYKTIITYQRNEMRGQK